MALINCPECEKQISDKTTACPFCGCPTETKKPKQKDDSYQKTVTIEKTGKTWKGMWLYAWGSIILGGLIGVNDYPGVGAFLFIAGIILLIASKVGKWWYHE